MVWTHFPKARKPLCRGLFALVPVDWCPAAVISFLFLYGDTNDPPFLFPFAIYAAIDGSGNEAQIRDAPSWPATLPGFLVLMTADMWCFSPSKALASPRWVTVFAIEVGLYAASPFCSSCWFFFGDRKRLSLIR